MMVMLPLWGSLLPWIVIGGGLGPATAQHTADMAQVPLSTAMRPVDFSVARPVPRVPWAAAPLVFAHTAGHERPAGGISAGCQPVFFRPAPEPRAGPVEVLPSPCDRA